MNSKNSIKSILLFGLIFIGQGLYATEIEFPLTQAFCYFPFFQHQTLDKQQLQLSMELNYSSVYAFDRQKININDMETLNTTISFSYGLTRRLTFEGYYRGGIAYGGVMDKFIMDFHKLFHMPVGGRDIYPRNIVQYTYKDKFSYDAGLTWSAPLVLGVLGRIWSKNYISLNGRLAVGLPLGEKPGFSSKKGFITPGLILVYENKAKKISALWANHLAFFAAPNWMAGEDLKKHIFHSELRVDYKRIFCGFLYRGSPFKKDELANAACVVYLGVKFLKYFQLALVEEFPPLDTTPDVCFNLRINLLGY